MLGSPKIKLDRALYDKLAEAAQAAGYATTDEFIVHVLEKTVADLGGAQDEDEVRKQLRGLGYIE